jgi:hypothetical protein
MMSDGARFRRSEGFFAAGFLRGNFQLACDYACVLAATPPPGVAR